MMSANDGHRVTAPEVLHDDRRLVLGDLVNRVLDKGMVIAGRVTIAVADIDLIQLDLNVVLTSVETALQRHLARDADLSLLRRPDSRAG